MLHVSEYENSRFRNYIWNAFLVILPICKTTHILIKFNKSLSLFRVRSPIFYHLIWSSVMRKNMIFSATAKLASSKERHNLYIVLLTCVANHNLMSTQKKQIGRLKCWFLAFKILDRLIQIIGNIHDHGQPHPQHKILENCRGRRWCRQAHLMKYSSEIRGDVTNKYVPLCTGNLMILFSTWRIIY